MSALMTSNQTFGLNATTMQGVVYNGVPFETNVETVPVPVLQDGQDAIVKISTSALCGSDLHTYHGITGAGQSP